MIFPNRTAIGVALALGTIATVQSVEAQVTTASVRGTVTDDEGMSVVGASVRVVHEPSGTASNVTTGNTGTFSARNLRVGGPYAIEITGDNIAPLRVEDVFLSLDDKTNLNLTASGTRTLETVVVSATRVGGNSLDSGLGFKMDLEALDDVASIDRDITDAALSDPLASVNVQSTGAKELSIAGANNRYNSLTIDGVALNDRFGLNANGYPTQRSPISFDAIESLSIESAPYDTEFNGFTGGTINVVTKSGTNELEGSAFYFQTNDGFAGSEIRDQKRDRDFFQNTFGFTVGGPIFEDRLFFFASFEYFEEDASLMNGPLGSGAINQRPVTAAQITEITSIMKEVYNFDPLSFSGVPPVKDEKILTSLDWNINDEHRLKLSYIKTDGSQIREQDGNSSIERGDVPVLGMPSSWYNRSETVTSYIAHVYSDWTPNLSTEFKFALTDQVTGQISLGGTDFPLFTVGVFQVENGVNTHKANVSLGPDRYRHGNSLAQDFTQIKAKAEYVHENHVIKVGFEREAVNVNNLFAPASEGMYYFTNLEALRNRQASAIHYENAISNNENDRRANWGYDYNSLFVQDTWDVSNEFTLLYGFRYDFYGVNGTIRENARFKERHGYTNTIDIGGQSLFLPRLGFNWSYSDNLTIRGGIGRFSGGSPNVWVSNTYSNDGVFNGRYQVRSGTFTVPNTPDEETGQYIPADVLRRLSEQEPDGPVAALHPDFKIPSTMKLNIGAAWESNLPWAKDWVFTGDILWNQLSSAPFWFDASCDQTGNSPDNRPVYACGGSRGPEAIVLSSIDKGGSTIFALSAAKEWDLGVSLFASYTYSDVDDIGMGTSSTAASNYAKTPRYSLQLPQTGRSNFEVKHQLKISATYKQEFYKDYETKISLFGVRRSGQGYSYTFNTDGRNDVFGIREGRADDAGALFYVPYGRDDPKFSPASFGGNDGAINAFFDYINNSELAQYKGQITKRNGDLSRWMTLVDLRITQEFRGVRDNEKSIFFLDILNLGNFLNSDWGVIERVAWEYNHQVASARIENGQYVYDNLRTRLNKELLLGSLWQAQIGIKYIF